METKNDVTGLVALKIGYTQFVMDVGQATTLFSLLVNGAKETLDYQWNSNTSKSEPRVKPLNVDMFSINVLPKEVYAMGKMLQAADDKAKESQGETK